MVGLVEQHDIEFVTEAFGLKVVQNCQELLDGGAKMHCGVNQCEKTPRDLGKPAKL